MNVNMIVLALPKGLGDPKDHEGLLKLLNGDYDTRAILYYIDPESKNIHHEVNRYFAEDPNDDSFIEITKTEYEARRALANELKLKRARMVESSDAVYGKEE